MNRDFPDLDVASAAEGVHAAWVEGRPDGEGSLGRFGVKLPAYVEVCYYAACQGHDPYGGQYQWPAGANRLHSRHMEKLGEMTPGGLLLLLRLKDQSHLALLPLPGSHTAASFRWEAGQLVLDVSSFGTEPVALEAPLLAWARGEDPYEAAWRAWRLALGHPLLTGGTCLRHEKPYPEAFEYLGWCSWEQYKTNIDEATMLGAVDAIEASGLPIRYVLVDDGHEQVADRKLVDFRADAAKFPRGLKPLLERRRPEGIRWCGLWTDLNGMWEGISPRHTMTSLEGHLAAVSEGGTIKAKGEAAHVRAYLEEMLHSARGFDFVKVDDQAQCLKQYRGAKQGVYPAMLHNRVLEALCREQGLGLINCMAHNSVCAFNTVHSAVTRCSADYKVGNAKLSKAHIHQSFANALYFGPTVWLDHDMFHSSDPAAGRAMAISKALSGGPIYLSDDPREFDAANVRPLCLENGRLLRPLAPGAPLPDCIYMNPLESQRAYRVVAPLEGGAAAVGLFNLSEPGRAVSGRIQAADWRWADVMRPEGGPRAAPPEGLILYDHQNGRAMRLESDQEVMLEGFEGRLYLLCPIVHGWSVIGRRDKFLSPAAARVMVITPEELVLRLEEAGGITVWSDEPPTADRAGVEVKAIGPQVWAIHCGKSGDLPGLTVRLRRVKSPG